MLIADFSILGTKAFPLHPSELAPGRLGCVLEIRFMESQGKRDMFREVPEVERSSGP